MLHITLADMAPTHDPTDPLKRDFSGWDLRRSTMENWDNNRAYWVLGARAERESYVLFSHRGTVVMAAQIDGIVDASGKPGRKIMEGTPLSRGHPVHDAYVAKSAPERARGARNPITYIDSNVGGWRCGCGCGAEIFAGEFVRGHEQTALHQRVAKIGTIPEFLRWFDAVHGGAEPATGVQPAMTLSRDGRLDLTVDEDGRVTLRFTAVDDQLTGIR